MLNILSFFRAALSWVLTGVPIAILAANQAWKTDDTSAKSQRIATGAALGLLLGVALNSTGLWESHALGFAIGPLWGIALAAIWDERNTESSAD